ncbi:FMN-binding protein [Pseudomaricurvus sp. HS19]|uniref:FMN-binding protein n=1 Tax=Pseudomaricurvus sp. HS19 TaxID=2692626 RepID=UPI00136C214B|nr:FMN-binding protein [Pseudomaricurvus sp. HS19]MYM63248.1 FMN-binding protein [Pseudomaricurvus sp. HS19]
MHRLLITMVLAALVVSMPAQAQRGSFLSMEEMRQNTFGEQAAALEWQTLWVNQEQRDAIEAILGHRFHGLRIRYLGDGQRTLWKFEEIGKEQLITVGVVVDSDRIANIEVMEYRESRGGEVRYPFFTGQFQGLGLLPEQAPALDGHIDGITGATLSVRAMTKIATLALFCHQLTPFTHRESSSQTAAR